MFQKLLLAYNGTREGKPALLACAEITSFVGTHTHLLAVASLPTGMFMGDGYVSEELLNAEKNHSEEVLNEGIEQLRRMGFSATGYLAVGEPVEEICRLAAELKADPIVIGHQQRASFASRWWCGSVGKALLDHAPRSIFVARTRPTSTI